MKRVPSFRTRIVVTVLGVAVVPLALVGVWLTRATAQSGERLVRDRLSLALDQTVLGIGSSWVRRRSELLDFAEEPSLRQLLDNEPLSDVDSLKTLFDDRARWVHRMTIFGEDGEERWTARRTTSIDPLVSGAFEPGLTISLDIYDRGSGEALGILEAEIDVTALLPRGGAEPALAGMVLGVFEPGSQVSLLALPFDPSLLSNERFTWAGDDWLSDTRTLQEPPVVLTAAAPLSPFVAPFEEAARRGSWVLFIVALVGVGLAVLLANRLTRSLKGLSVAAEAVSRGDLYRRIEVRREDEVGKVAQAFNTMTESLRRTLAELANRESLAAVGEFAASLAHEVRNPLTAIRIDLQSVEEQLPERSPLREAQARALKEVVRLDRTVGRTLKVARSGVVHLRPIDLAAPVTAAAETARSAFDDRDARLACERPSTPIPIIGDAEALQQVFLNILQNAASSLEPGGRAEVAFSYGDGLATVCVRDDGKGMPEQDRRRAFEPLFTTRQEGTGLGLTIARRIVVAHGGKIEIDSEEGVGTSVFVRLPLRRSGTAS